MALLEQAEEFITEFIKEFITEFINLSHYGMHNDILIQAKAKDSTS